MARRCMATCRLQLLRSAPQHSTARRGTAQCTQQLGAEQDTGNAGDVGDGELPTRQPPACKGKGCGHHAQTSMVALHVQWCSTSAFSLFTVQSHNENLSATCRTRLCQAGVQVLECGVHSIHSSLRQRSGHGLACRRTHSSRAGDLLQAYTQDQAHISNFAGRGEAFPTHASPPPRLHRLLAVLHAKQEAGDHPGGVRRQVGLRRRRQHGSLLRGTGLREDH